MTSEDYYTYSPAYETTIYSNKGGGITIDQSRSYSEEALVVLTLDQARWLSKRLVDLVNEIEQADDVGGR